MMNQTLQDLITRRSCRKYKAEQIREDELTLILEAGMYAPSGMGKQSAIMIVVQDKDTLHTLSQINAAVMGHNDMDPFYGAPTVVAVLADKSSRTYVNDASLVLGNLMNAAHSIGIGSCWIHRAKETFESEAAKVLLQQLGMEGDYEGIGFCILGYATDEPAAKPRKENYIYRV